jgi:UDP:flavonoid glycosyltransferase YjiC (YdhE family)
MQRVLFAVSGQSIAHTLRPLPVAEQLRAWGYDVVFGGRGPYLRFVAGEGFPIIPFPTLPYERVIRWQHHDGVRLYSASEVGERVAVQRRYLEDLKPRLVVQDGPELTLPFAAAECEIPIWSITNATVLDLAGKIRYVPFRRNLNRLLGWSPKVAHHADSAIEMARNIRLHFPLGIYQGRKRLSNAAYGRHLMPDLPELFGMPPTDESRQFVGPILYEPETPLPPWWDDLDDDKPAIYLAVGSSGGLAGLTTMVKTLAELGVQVLLSTADFLEQGELPDNVFYAPFLPRDEVLSFVDAMVYHGGSATTYQALKHAVPVVAIPGHFDQELNARALAHQGLGLSLLPQKLTAEKLKEAVLDVLDNPRFERRLEHFSELVAESDGPLDAATEIAEALDAAGGHGFRFRGLKRKRRPMDPQESRALAEKVPCSLCGLEEESGQGGPSASEKMEEVEDLAFGIGPRHRLVRCARCGSAYLSPAPTWSTLAEVYPLESDYFEASDDGKVDSKTRKACLRRLKEVTRVCDLQAGKRLLDLGCQSGLFLKVAHAETDCEVLAFEPLEKLGHFAWENGVVITQPTPEVMQKMRGQVDCIVSWQGLERHRSMKEVLGWCRELMSPDGVFLMETITADGPLGEVDWPRIRIAPDLDGIKDALQAHGFSMPKIRKLKGGRHLIVSHAQGGQA